MNMVNGLPEQIKVKALKGFRGSVAGRFVTVNPGDVVTVSRELAVDLRQASKAVMTDEPENIQKNYMPERKRSKQLAAAK